MGRREVNSKITFRKMVRVSTWYPSPIEKEKSSFSSFIHVQGKKESSMKFWRDNRSS